MYFKIAAGAVILSLYIFSAAFVLPLFLLSLILIAGTGKRIFITVTGFTLAHSLTLSYLDADIEEQERRPDLRLREADLL